MPWDLAYSKGVAEYFFILPYDLKATWNKMFSRRKEISIHKIRMGLILNKG